MEDIDAKFENFINDLENSPMPSNLLEVERMKTSIEETKIRLELMKKEKIEEKEVLKLEENQLKKDIENLKNGYYCLIMNEMRGENSISEGGSIRASRSDLSISTSSPRLESNATSSTSCFTDGLTRRDLSSDLICAICNQLFERPVLVTCGHSFCEACIERRCRHTRECFICQKDVGDFEAMIPSITLDNLVRKLKLSDNGSLDDLFICEEASKSRMERSLSTRSKKRCYFSIAAPTVCASPINLPRRHPLSPNALPVKSSLKYAMSPSRISMQSDSSYCEVDGMYKSGENAAKPDHFRRNSFGRRSERFTTSTRSNRNETGEVDNENDKNFKRNSLLRRSWNALKQKTTGRRSFTLIIEEPEDYDDNEIVDEQIDEKFGESKRRSLLGKAWKKLFVSKKSNRRIIMDKRGVANPTLKYSPQEPLLENCEVDVVKHNLGYYAGIGKKFERVASGEEIAIVVFGHTQSGKTTFVRALKECFINCDSSPIRVLTLSERYSLGGIYSLPYPEGDNRLPHIVSVVMKLDEDTETFIDIIDPEYDDSCLPQAYMDACDAAFFIIDTRNCASILSAHQIQRNLKHGQEKQVPCEIVVNVPDENTESRLLSANVCENLAKNMKSSMVEICAKKLNHKAMEELLFMTYQQICESRRMQRSRQGILV
ncbi:unnamed protein product [Caenorhabditis bovis]|uniref:RING-type domain-containing protein n=1 Tax=Caenorhabditis bovis TaxID=2654633 RepID=A0A8S1EKW2_9PELO|nr:unnamed protein product [Caenorhabditis bovis]